MAARTTVPLTAGAGSVLRHLPGNDERGNTVMRATALSIHHRIGIFEPPDLSNRYSRSHSELDSRCVISLPEMWLQRNTRDTSVCACLVPGLYWLVLISVHHQTGALPNAQPLRVPRSLYKTVQRGNPPMRQCSGMPVAVPNDSPSLTARSPEGADWRSSRSIRSFGAVRAAWACLAACALGLPLEGGPFEGGPFEADRGLHAMSNRRSPISRRRTSCRRLRQPSHYPPWIGIRRGRS